MQRVGGWPWTDPIKKGGVAERTKSEYKHLEAFTNPLCALLSAAWSDLSSSPLEPRFLIEKAEHLLDWGFWVVALFVASWTCFTFHPTAFIRSEEASLLMLGLIIWPTLYYNGVVGGVYRQQTPLSLLIDKELALSPKNWLQSGMWELLMSEVGCRMIEISEKTRPDGSAAVEVEGRPWGPKMDGNGSGNRWPRKSIYFDVLDSVLRGRSVVT